MRAWDKILLNPFTGGPGVASVGLCFPLFLLFAVFLLLPSGVFAECLCGNGDGQPTLYEPITIDGDMADWGTPTQAGTVLADEDNNVCDGPGSGLIDLDAPVQSTGRDIVQFSFTYDDTWLYFYTERTGSDSNIQNFVYYADVDNDGFMEDGEPVIWAEWQGGNRSVAIYVCQYEAVDPVNGDPVVDPSSGYADGYALPGDIGNIPKNPDYSGRWGSADGSSMEFGIEWSVLGFSGPVGHTLHISSTNANKNASNLGAQIDDNLGGCGGGIGSVQFADLEFSGAYTFSGYWGDTLWGLHHLVNLGNGPDSFSLAYSVSGPWSPSVSFFLDDGDGLFTTADTPISSNLDLAAGGSVDVIIVYGIGSFVSGTAAVTTAAVSLFNPIVTDDVVDLIDVLFPSITSVKYVSSVADSTPATPGGADKALPGAVVTYRISVTNGGNAAPDAGSLMVRDTIQPSVRFFAGDGSVSPVTFDPGTTALSFIYTSLDSTTDDVAFTSQDGPSPAYTYTPVPDPEGFDGAVRGFRVVPEGLFDGSTSFHLTYDVEVP